MSNGEKRAIVGRGLAGYRSVMLLGSALAGVMCAPAFAQQNATDSAVTTLPVLNVPGGPRRDDDRNSVIASQTTIGGRIAAQILDIPASVSVITENEIERRNAGTTEEVLQYTSAVTTDFYGSDERFDYLKIRGLDANMYRDGLAIGRAFLGVREDPYAFERVEVLKGANSSAFGLGDPGGAVNYVTKRPKSERFGEIYLTGGAFGTAQIGGDMGDNITEDDTLSYRVAGKLQVGNGEIDETQDNEALFLAGLAWRPSDATELSIVYDRLFRDGTPGSGGHPEGTDFDREVFFGDPDFNSLDVDRHTVSTQLDHDFGNGLSLSSNARYSDTKTGYDYTYISGSAGGTLATRDQLVTDSTREHFIIDGRLQYDFSVGDIDSSTLVGTEYSWDSTTSGSNYIGGASLIDWTDPDTVLPGPAPFVFISDSASENRVNALYLQQNLTLFDRLTLTGGLRNDWLDLEQTDNIAGTVQQADFSEFTTQAGLNYRFTPEIAGFVSYAESAMPAAPFGTNELTLEPERGDQWEIGVKYQPEAFPALFTASLFDLSKSNITRIDPVTLQPSAIGEVRVRGLDIEAKAEVMENLTVTAAYAYMMSEIVDDGAALANEGNELSRVPNHIASLWVDYTVPAIGSLNEMTFGLGGRYTGEYFFTDDNATSAEASFVVDAAFTYQVQENTSFQLNVNNVFDEKHVAQSGFGATFYNPGRSVTATVRHSW